MKIAVYAIAKNEAKHVERFMRTAMEADGVYVLDTGSTDETRMLLDALGASVVKREIKPWDFAKARNIALARIPSDYDLCLCLDLDEVMEEGWRVKIEAVWHEGVTRVCYPFAAAHTADGTPSTTFTRNLCHARFGYHWQWPVHECIMPDACAPPEVVVTCEMVCHHWPDNSKSRSSYFDLLTDAVAGDYADDPRMNYYYARELQFRDDHGAAQAFEKYLALPNPYTAERAEAMRLRAHCTEDMAERFQWLMRACAEDPSRRDQWVDLAWWHFHQRNYAAAYGAAVTALGITDRFAGFMSYAPAWGVHAYAVAAYSAWYLGLSEVAADLIREGLAIEYDAHVAAQAREFMGVVVDDPNHTG